MSASAVRSVICVQRQFERSWEPLPLDSPLLGRHNVVHTPHAAGRTRDANHAFADDATARFRPR